MWGTYVSQGKREDLIFTPAGQFTDAMASDIFNALEQRELPNGPLIVAGCRFENKERVRGAIHDLARQLQFALKNNRVRSTGSIERIGDPPSHDRSVVALPFRCRNRLQKTLFPRRKCP